MGSFDPSGRVAIVAGTGTVSGGDRVPARRAKG